MIKNKITKNVINTAGAGDAFVGSLVAAPEVIEQIAKAPPNNLGSNIVAQRGAIAGLKAKREWFPGVLETTRNNQALILETIETIEGLRVPVTPSSGNFLIIETIEAGITPPALCVALSKRNIMIRQGSYHTETFGDRFVKVSTSTPRDWVEALCEHLPDATGEAKDVRDDVQLF